MDWILHELLVSEPAKCQWQVPGWATIHGRDYYLSGLEPMTWAQAEAKALEQNGYLAEIETKAENHIFDQIKHCKFASSSSATARNFYTRQDCHIFSGTRRQQKNIDYTD